MPALTAPGEGQVAIHRDGWGTYHIVAPTEGLSAFAMGYAQAEDHLEEMLAHFLLVRGELASLVGPAALAMDTEQHVWQVLAESRAAYEELEPEYQATPAGFIAGVQRFMDDHPDKVPSWAPPLEPCLPLGRMRVLLSLWLTMSADLVLQRTGIQRLQNQGASNQWVLAPWRTADGRTIVLGDPHLDLGGLLEPGADGTPLLGLFQCVDYTTTVDDFRYAGYAFVGTPGGGTGHNFHTVTTATTGGPACSDVYRIVVDPADPNRYLFDGEERRIEGFDVEIRVAGQDEPNRIRVEYAFVNGLRSPVVARDAESAYVICTPYQDTIAASVRQNRDIARARNVAEMKEALRACCVLPQNILVADRDGGIFFVHGGRVPVRAPGVDWRRPIDGNTAATEWLGLHDLDDQVQVENPASGYLQNCNVAPDVMVADHREPSLEPDGYLDYLFNDRPGRQTTRGARAVELLSATTAATVADAIAMAVDVRWVDTPQWQLALTAAVGLHPEVVASWMTEARGYLHDLLHFDGDALPDSVAALRWATWREQLATRAPGGADRFKEVADAIAARLPLDAEGAGWLLEAIEPAMDHLRKTFGRTDVPYGEVYKIGRGDQVLPARGGTFLSRPLSSAEVRGEDSADRTSPAMVAPLRVGVSGPPLADGTRRAVHGGFALRLTVLGEQVETYSVIQYGQSSDPASPHYADQVRLFSQGEVRRMPTEPDELAEQVVHTTLLTP
jgi:acyl-homoserine lactone acylase PvdQ